MARGPKYGAPSKARPSKKKTRPPRQAVLPGVLSPKNRKIHDLAIEYKEQVGRRQEEGKLEVELKKKLIKAMNDAGLERYRHGTVLVELVHEAHDSVKVELNQKLSEVEANVQVEDAEPEPGQTDGD